MTTLKALNAASVFFVFFSHAGRMVSVGLCNLLKHVNKNTCCFYLERKKSEKFQYTILYTILPSRTLFNSTETNDINDLIFITCWRCHKTVDLCYESFPSLNHFVRQSKNNRSNARLICSLTIPYTIGFVALPMKNKYRRIRQFVNPKISIQNGNQVTK